MEVEIHNAELKDFIMWDSVAHSAFSKDLAAEGLTEKDLTSQHVKSLWFKSSQGKKKYY